jgi:hypothetical protein
LLVGEWVRGQNRRCVAWLNLSRNTMQDQPVYSTVQCYSTLPTTTYIMRKLLNKNDLHTTTRRMECTRIIYIHIYAKSKIYLLLLQYYHVRNNRLNTSKFRKNNYVRDHTTFHRWCTGCVVYLLIFEFFSRKREPRMTCNFLLLLNWSDLNHVVYNNIKFMFDLFEWSFSQALPSSSCPSTFCKQQQEYSFVIDDGSR